MIKATYVLFTFYAHTHSLFYIYNAADKHYLLFQVFMTKKNYYRERTIVDNNNYHSFECRANKLVTIKYILQLNNYSTVLFWY